VSGWQAVDTDEKVYEYSLELGADGRSAASGATGCEISAERARAG
jgi:hypothetical protein